MRSLRMKPQKAGGRIESVRVGRKWTRVTIVLSTERLKVQTQKATDSAQSTLSQLREAVPLPS